MASSIRVFRSLARTSRRPYAYTCLNASRPLRATQPRFLSNSTVPRNDAPKAPKFADGIPPPEEDNVGLSDGPKLTSNDGQKFYDELDQSLSMADLSAEIMKDEEDDFGYVVPRTGEEATDDPMFPEWEADDISSIAHSELDRHREARHYARIMVYEMPKLSKLAVPFKVPDGERFLRFRYTTYMGVQHPAEPKVVVEVSPDDLDFDASWQRNKFIKLCGVRYNPSKELVKMSCEIFKLQAQNKRYLMDLIESLIQEAKNPNDKFIDVPFDFRRHKTKPRRPWFYFPKAWRMTEEKTAQKRWKDWNKATPAQREQSLILHAANEARGTEIAQTKKDYIAFLSKQSQQLDDRAMADVTRVPGDDDKTIQMTPVSATEAFFKRQAGR